MHMTGNVAVLHNETKMGDR